MTRSQHRGARARALMNAHRAHRRAKEAIARQDPEWGLLWSMTAWRLVDRAAEHDRALVCSGAESVGGL